MKSTYLLIIITGLLITSKFQVHAQAGTLDPTFGNGGKVTTNFLNSYDHGSYVAIQSDGKILVSGYCFSGSNNDFALVRYNTDGSLDSTFGNGGKDTTDFGNTDDYGSGITIQNDGKILMTGVKIGRASCRERVSVLV